jgi:nucleotide-binding universal stress UspA family protein
MIIVVGYVLTPEGDAALDAAIAEAKLRDASLYVVHSSKGGSSESQEEVEAYDAANEALTKRLRDEGVAFELHDLVRGNTPAEDVLEAAQEQQAGLVVIGLRHRSLVGKLLLGSNANEILLDAPCPVLAVKAPRPA